MIAFLGTVIREPQGDFGDGVWYWGFCGVWVIDGFYFGITMRDCHGEKHDAYDYAAFEFRRIGTVFPGPYFPFSLTPQETTPKMSKTILTMGVAMLMSVAVSSAQADNGIAAGTLADMGLGGLDVMSDSDALAIRGKGYTGGNYKGCKVCPRTVKSPWSSAFGNSFATYEDKKGNVSHSENGYAAEGAYSASGENFSEAGGVVTSTETVVIDGSTKSITTSQSTRVFAGGYSSAMSF